LRTAKAAWPASKKEVCDADERGAVCCGIASTGRAITSIIATAGSMARGYGGPETPSTELPRRAATCVGVTRARICMRRWGWLLSVRSEEWTASAIERAGERSKGGSGCKGCYADPSVGS